MCGSPARRRGRLGIGRLYADAFHLPRLSHCDV